MDKFVNTLYFPILNQYQTRNLNRTRIPSEIEAINKIYQPVKIRTRKFYHSILLDFQRKFNTNTPQIITHNINIRNIG